MSDPSRRRFLASIGIAAVGRLFAHERSNAEYSMSHTLEQATRKETPAARGVRPPPGGRTRAFGASDALTTHDGRLAVRAGPVGLRLVAVIAFWWEDCPGSRLRAGSSGLTDALPIRRRCPCRTS